MNDDTFLTIEDVEQEFKIPRTSLYMKSNPKKTPSEHLLPSYKPAKTLLFKRSDVIKWIERHKQRAS